MSDTTLPAGSAQDPAGGSSTPAKKPRGPVAQFLLWLLKLLGSLLLFFLLVGLNPPPEIYETAGLFLPLAIWTGVGALILAMYAIVPGALKTRDLPSDLRPGRWSGIGSGFAVGIGFFVVTMLVLFLAGVYKVDAFQPDWTYLLVALLHFLVVAIAEEVLFRGVLFRMVDEKFGLWVALAVSAFLFGLAHLPQGDWLSTIAIAMEAGVMLGLAYKYSGNLWFPIGIHWAWNFMEGPVFGTEVSGTPARTAFLKSHMEGPDILSGGSFGPEASLVTLLCGLALSALFLWFILRNRKRDPLSAG